MKVTFPSVTCIGCALWLCYSAIGPQDQPRLPLEAHSGFEGVIEAFEHSTIVALPDRHQDSTSSQFRLGLIAQPKFAGVVNDIVIEWANRLYQKTLDRYIAGEEVPEAELRRIWRNTTVINGLWDSPVYPEFLLAVRNVNSGLPKGRRLRVWAGDPPIDWTKVETSSDFAQFAAHRDDSIFSVIQENVLAKHRKALLIMGGGHFRRGVEVNGHTGIVDLLESADAMNRVFVVGVIPSLNHELTGYPSRSFFFTRGTWLEELSTAHGMIIYDGVLTLPDGEPVRPAPSTYSDPVYLHELDRRWRIVFGRPFDPANLP